MSRSGPHYSQAPLAYLLSAVAALTYLAAALLISAARTGAGGRWLIAVSTTELLGVLAVGTTSLLIPAEFPDETVWSHYGSGYGFLPAIPPFVVLVWYRTIRRMSTANQ